MRLNVRPGPESLALPPNVQLDHQRFSAAPLQGWREPSQPSPQTFVASGDVAAIVAAPPDPVAICFPKTLFAILSSCEYRHILSWLPHGRGFVLRDRKLFVSKVMPRHFSGVQFTSFTRRLKRWGFARVPRGPEFGAYYHERFERDHPDLVRTMIHRSEDSERTTTGIGDDAEMEAPLLGGEDDTNHLTGEEKKENEQKKKKEEKNKHEEEQAKSDAAVDEPQRGPEIVTDEGTATDIEAARNFPRSPQQRPFNGSETNHREEKRRNTGTQRWQQQTPAHASRRQYGSLPDEPPKPHDPDDNGHPGVPGVAQGEHDRGLPSGQMSQLPWYHRPAEGQPLSSRPEHRDQQDAQLSRHFNNMIPPPEFEQEKFLRNIEQKASLEVSRTLPRDVATLDPLSRSKLYERSNSGDRVMDVNQYGARMNMTVTAHAETTESKFVASQGTSQRMLVPAPSDTHGEILRTATSQGLVSRNRHTEIRRMAARRLQVGTAPQQSSPLQRSMQWQQLPPSVHQSMYTPLPVTRIQQLPPRQLPTNARDHKFCAKRLRDLDEEVENEMMAAEIVMQAPLSLLRLQQQLPQQLPVNARDIEPRTRILQELDEEVRKEVWAAGVVVAGAVAGLHEEGALVKKTNTRMHTD